MVNAVRTKKWSKRFGFPAMPGRDFNGEFARGQERLLVRLAAAQGVAAHAARAHAQFAAHQTVRPMAVDQKSFFEQADASLRVELLDDAEQPLAGYSGADACVLDRSGTRAPLVWKGNAPTAAVNGRFRLRVSFEGSARGGIRLYALYVTGAGGSESR